MQAAVQTVAVDTLYNNINYLFSPNWKCFKTQEQLRYTNSFVPLDEYVIDLNNTNNINIIHIINNA